MLVCPLCEEPIPRGDTFHDYINASDDGGNPSQSTVGHKTCGLLFNFFKMKVRSASKRELLVWMNARMGELGYDDNFRLAVIYRINKFYKDLLTDANPSLQSSYRKGVLGFEDIANMSIRVVVEERVGLSVGVQR